ncbi:MAG: hypothetical protein IT370_34000 [Deltaproteobacteria bacterium]|nr:hypothetical protein [Deltaproteobacteria bacterium]
MRQHHALTALLALLALAGCGDDDDGGARDGGGAADAALADAAIDASQCAVLWRRVGATGGATARVEGGALVLRATGTGSIGVQQTGLSGNFEASFEVESFSAGGTGAFVQAVLSNQDLVPDQLFTAGMGTSPVVGISAAMQPGSSDLEPVAATAATFRVVKTGNSITVTATAGGQTATVQGFYGQTPLQLGLQVGSNAGAVSGETVVRVSDFRVVLGSGGGTRPKPDDFGCDSLF